MAEMPRATPVSNATPQPVQRSAAPSGGVGWVGVVALAVHGRELAND